MNRTGPLIILLGSFCLPVCVLAQAIRIPAPVARPHSVLANTIIAVSASPASLNILLVPGGVADAPSPVTINTTLTNPLITTMDLYGYFLNSQTALTGSASHLNISSSAVLGLVPNGVPTTWTPFTQTNILSLAAAGLELSSITGLTVSTTRVYQLSLRIDLTSLPQMPADTYTGTLYLQAQIF